MSANNGNRAARRQEARNAPPQGPGLPADAMPPEFQGLFMEAMFWKQKYLELQQHSNQVISMLSRPAAAPEQVAGLFGPQPTETGESAAQEPASQE